MPSTFRRSSSVALLAFSALAQDIAVINTRVWTGDAWAEAIAVKGDRITAVGSTAEIRKSIGKTTRVIDASGQMVTPGFIDSHVHFIEGGKRLTSVKLRDANTKQLFIARLRDYAKTVPAGTWITGGDWEHKQWGGDLPERAWIDSVTPDHPVWVNRLDGHMGLANSAALRIAKVDKTTKDIEGGVIVRDADGEPTGVLKDNAQSLISRVVPEIGPVNERALEAAMKFVAAQGVTSIHHMGNWDDLALFDRFRQQNKLKTRIYAAVPLHTWQRLADRIQQSGRGDAWLRIGLLKGFVDGSLGSHTAAFIDPFTDAPGDRGLFVNTPEKLYEWTSGAARAGLQVAVHAIGDRAIQTQLSVFERVQSEQSLRDPRFRIEHAQHIAPNDIARFGKLGVIASMQPYHAIDDGVWAEKVIGEQRSLTTYAFRSLLDSKARLAFGSDWYVAPPTPIEGIYAAVTRQTLDDRNPGGWIPEQKILVEEALRAYTTGPAYASFEEQQKGSLQPGKLADFVILDRDLTSIKPHEIRNTKVKLTVVGGQIVYEAP